MTKKRKRRNAQQARRLAAFALSLALALSLGGCGNSKPEWEYHPITDVNDLKGRRVAVNLAWEADYLLSGREDLTVVQYDSFADIILALGYDKVDAFAVDGLVWKVFQANSTGLARVEPPCGSVGYAAYFSADRETLMEEYNRFLEGYRQTEAYADHMARLEDFDGLEYVGPEIPLTGTGETLRVATMAEEFPRAFLEAGEDVPSGFDLESLKLFANEGNYQLEFYYTVYDDIMQGLRSGAYDLAIGYLSDVYRDEVLDAGVLVSDLLDEIPVYFVEKTQKDISVALELE
jgi:ABC-type amino acid transport substrate-binding protein